MVDHLGVIIENFHDNIILIHGDITDKDSSNELSKC